MVQFVYDKLHNIAITSSYNLNEKWSFGAILFYKLVNPSPIQWVIWILEMSS
jgi:hypothetical protein